MIVKQEWNETDFADLNWHDSFLYSMTFPSDEQKISFDIDYIFKWEIIKNEGEVDTYGFWVSPCKLIFHDVMFLKVDLNFKDYVGIQIKEITRLDKTYSIANKDLRIWDFQINTELGNIIFESTGFSLFVMKQPRLSNSQASR